MNKSLVLALGALLVAAPAVAQEEAVLNVYNWSDYIAEDTIANFEAQTGIKVNYDVYDNNEIVDAKLLAGSSGYDIVVPSGQFPRTPDQGRPDPAARQVQAPQPGQSGPGGDGDCRKPGPRQCPCRALHDQHHRLRLQCRQGHRGAGRRRADR